MTRGALLPRSFLHIPRTSDKTLRLLTRNPGPAGTRVCGFDYVLGVFVGSIKLSCTNSLIVGKDCHEEDDQRKTDEGVCRDV